MININKNPNADTRTCNYAKVSKEDLLEASKQHISDVKKGAEFFANKIIKDIENHDFDKITEINHFHSDFLTGFKEIGWWENHRKINRHHLLQEDGIPKDVNLLDVIEFLTDCVMAGMARKGFVDEINLSSELLQKAFKNTIELLIKEVKVIS